MTRVCWVTLVEVFLQSWVNVAMGRTVRPDYLIQRIVEIVRQVICFLVLLGVVMGMPTEVQAKERLPNVLMIAVDDLRPDLGCYGNLEVHTPAIDALAATGRLFKRAYCQQAVCNPSRTSLMTGLRPNTTGITGNHAHFRDRLPDWITLPQHFKQNGYFAQSIGKIYHGVFPDGASKTTWDTMGDPFSWSVPTTRFGPRYYFTEEGINQAKASFLAMYGTQQAVASNAGDEAWAQKLVFGPMTEAPDVADEVLYDGKVALEAISALRSLKQRDQPFFLAVGFIKPHSPFVAPKKYWDLYDSKLISMPNRDALPQGAPTWAGHGSGEIRRYTDQPSRGAIPAASQRRMRHGYLACVSFVDAQVGKVLSELRRLELDENTIVVLFGDHGYHLGEQGLWGKTTNFELDTRVPLIIRTPEMAMPGEATSSISELVDVYPTLSQLAGITPPPALEGEDLSPQLISPAADPNQTALSQYPRGKVMGYSLRSGDWRYTEWLDQTSGQVASKELYRYQPSGSLDRLDAVETRNLVHDSENAERVRQLSKRLHQKIRVPFATQLVARPASELTPEVPARKVVFQRDDQHGFRIPALTSTKNGTLLAFAERRVGLSDHAKNDIVLRRSLDNGSTWEPMQVLVDEGGDSLNDPCVVVLKSGRILLRYTRFPEGVHARNSSHTVIAEPGYGGPRNVRVYLMHSDDHGLSWSEPKEVTRSFRRESAVSIGSPGLAIQLETGQHAGRILFPIYEVDDLGGGQRMTGNSVVFSDDQGESWSLSERISEGETDGGGNEAQVVELKDGTLLISSRVFGTRASARKMAKSSDGGETWTPFRLATEMLTPACMSSLLALDPADDGDSESLVHVVPNTKTRRANGRLFISKDQGEHWKPSVVIEPGPFAYACLCPLKNGGLGCLFEAGNYQSIVFQAVPRSMLKTGSDPHVIGRAEAKPVLGRTSFEPCDAGGFESLVTEVGRWTAAKGNVEIDDQHSRTGGQCLHLLGGMNHMVELRFIQDLDPRGIIFHAERWTRRSPFSFRVEASAGDGQWKEIYDGDDQVRIGRFSTRVAIPLPFNTTSLRFRCSSPPRSGLLIDDLSVLDQAGFDEASKKESPRDLGNTNSETLQFGRPFSDHMVLQADVELPVWGVAKSGSHVLVQLGADQTEAVADARGHWQVRFASRIASTQPVDLVAAVGADRSVIRDVLVGQVWLCAGQSNMEWALKKSAGGLKTLSSLDAENIRLLHLKGGASGSSVTYGSNSLARLVPSRFAEGQWQVASPESASQFSAVAWYFGQQLQKQLDVPIGLICPAVGGTPTEAWVSREALAADPDLKALVAGNWLENERLGDFCRERGRFNLAQAMESGMTIPSDSLGPNHPFKPGFMWEATIKPLTPFAIAGVIWYQGESNAETPFRVTQHQSLFHTLVDQWRRAWGRVDLPFLYVQLPALNRPHWPLFRDQQRRFLGQLDDVAMATTIDIGHPSNVHPSEKRAVGERLADLASDFVKPDESRVRHPASGPVFDSCVPDGNGLLLQFRTKIPGIESQNGQPIRHFEIASEHGDFVSANASIEGPNSLRVWNDEVQDPRHVRYAWKPFPEPPVNLVGAKGLPASPFSTRPQKSRPNVLLIVGEDHGCELSCYGDRVIETPHLDQLASEGILFEHGYVTQSVCSPSRSTLFTGLYPHQNGQLGLATHQFRWFHKWPTTYSILKRAGYRTGLIGKTHVLPEEAVEGFVDFRFQTSSNFAKKNVSDYASKAGEFFAASDEPFFMTVNYPDAHWPLQGRVGGLPERQVDPNQVQVMPYVGSGNPRLREVVRNYYDCMLRLDACVGQLLNELSRAGKDDNTLVIFVGDHGAQMARGKVTVYEGGMRVPWIARWPGIIQPGQRSEALVSTIDLLPTLMDAAGVRTPQGLPGKSLRPLFSGIQGKTFRRYLFCERNCDAAHLTFPQRTVRDERYKLIHSLVRDREDPAARYYRVHGASHWAGSLTDEELKGATEQTREGYARWLNPPEYQLYDLQADPHEWNDLAEDPVFVGIKKRLQKALRDWQQETEDPLRDESKLAQLMQETDAVNGLKRRSPEAGWQYLRYLRPASLPGPQLESKPKPAVDPVPAARLPLSRSQPLFVSGSHETHTFRIPAIVTACNGDLIAACDARRKNAADLIHQRDIDIVYRRSSDGGKTWTPIQELDSVEDGGCSDPSLLVDRVTGDLFCFYNYMVRDLTNKEFRFYVQRSSDHGVSWSDAIDFTDQVATPDLKLSFKFVTSGRGIQTRDGTLLHNFVRVGKGATLFASRDHGQTWSATGEVTPGDESKVVQLNDGSLMVNSRFMPGKRFVHRSADSGKHWKSVELGLPDPRCNASILQYTSKRDGYAKNRLLFCNSASNQGRKNLAVRISYDEGRSWSRGKVIDPGPSAYSELTVLSDGSIGVLYEPGYKEVRFTRFTLKDLTDDADRLQQPFMQAGVSGD